MADYSKISLKFLNKPIFSLIQLALGVAVSFIFVPFIIGFGRGMGWWT